MPQDGLSHGTPWPHGLVLRSQQQCSDLAVPERACFLHRTWWPCVRMEDGLLRHTQILCSFNVEGLGLCTIASSNMLTSILP